MKRFAPGVPLAPKAERPFPVNEILWGSQDGGGKRASRLQQTLISANIQTILSLCKNLVKPYQTPRIESGLLTNIY